MLNIFKSNKTKIEEAKQKLILQLKEGSINYLLSQMVNENYFTPLLLKEKTPFNYSSENTIKWYALRRAEELNLPSEKKQLLEILQIENDLLKKDKIYFCLAHYCKNTLDSELFNFLMKCLESEKDNNCKLSILIGIKYMTKESSLNIEPLKKIAISKNIRLKTSAIIALQKTNDIEVEELLINIFITTNDNHIKQAVTWSLATVGTKKSISVLKETYKITRDYSLREYINQTIDEIEQRN